MPKKYFGIEEWKYGIYGTLNQIWDRIWDLWEIWETYAQYIGVRVEKLLYFQKMSFVSKLRKCFKISLKMSFFTLFLEAALQIFLIFSRIWNME